MVVLKNNKLYTIMVLHQLVQRHVQQMFQYKIYVLYQEQKFKLTNV